MRAELSSGLFVVDISYSVQKTTFDGPVERNGLSRHSLWEDALTRRKHPVSLGFVFPGAEAEPVPQREEGRLELNLWMQLGQVQPWLAGAEPVHHKALPLLTGAQLIHTDKLSEKVEDDTMPIRRSVNASSRETPPKSKPAEGEEVKADAEVTSEESASVGEEQETETLPPASSEAEQPKEPENEGKEETKSSEETKKDEKDQSKEKEKKVKKTIPAWATLSASQLARAQKQTQMAATSRPKMDAILTEAIKVKGKGASGSFVVVSNAGKTVPKARDRKKSTLAPSAEQQVKLEDVLPLAFTRLCEPKEASYSLIKKYVSQYYPKLKVDVSTSSIALHTLTTPTSLYCLDVKVPPWGLILLGSGCFSQHIRTVIFKGFVSPLFACELTECPPRPNVLLKVSGSVPGPCAQSCWRCRNTGPALPLGSQRGAVLCPALSLADRPQLLKNALQRAVEKGQLEQITGKGASGTFQLKKSGEKPLLGGTLMEDAILSAIAAMNEPKTCSTTALKKYILENYPGTNSNFQVHLLKRTLQKCEKNGWMEQISGKGFSGTFQLCFPYYPRMQKRPPPKSRSRAPPMKRRESKPKPRKTPTARRGKAKPPPKVKTPAKKAKPAAPAIKKASGGSSSKKPAASGRKEVKPSAKGKSTMRKSLRAKKSSDWN
ncbi:hypothetical protein IHE44_0007789 [Lamprotornis superbus]|uniref:Heterochromatin protein 1-binding protein 3 n=1 Tax=Lamprotornis superbus TaxID=245042 RepID=A0A835TUU4_9PASS|nr:hypothetical protein IHE44_0007789 [Lamprotornis superbus]